MTDDDLLKLAKQRVDERLGLAVHVSIYLLVNTGLVIAWWVSGASYPWFLWPLMGWGTGVLAHILTFVFGPNSARGVKAIDREVARLRASYR